MKEILIRRKTSEELRALERVEALSTDICYDNPIDVYLDGEKIENLESFTITIDRTHIEPLYTIKQYMPREDT